MSEKRIVSADQLTGDELRHIENVREGIDDNITGIINVIVTEVGWCDPPDEDQFREDYKARVRALLGKEPFAGGKLSMK